MSLLGRIYVLVAVTLFVLLSSWALWTLRENANLVEVTVFVPALRTDTLGEHRSVHISVGALLLGWIVAGGALMWMAARAPYRIRAAAGRLRRIRELEKEVQTLRVLPLRQQEEDELLAQEARLDLHERRVMSAKVDSDSDYSGTEERRSDPVSWAGATEPKSSEASEESP